MKSFICWMLAITALLLIPDAALAEGDNDPGLEEGVAYWMDMLDTDAWERLMDSLPQESRILWEGIGPAELMGEYASGGASAFTLLEEADLLAALGAAIKTAASPFFTLLSLALMTALIRALAPGGTGASDAAAFAIRAFALVTALSLFVRCARECAQVIHELGSVTELALPPLTAILTAAGRTGTAGVLQPAGTMLTGFVSGVMRTAVIPLSISAGVVGMLDQMGPSKRVSELSKLMSSCAKWIVGGVTAVFLGSASIRSLAAASFDGVTVKTAKYALSQLVPVVGGMVSGTMETVLGGAQLVKNAAGIAAILLAVTVALPKLLRLGAGMLLFRFVGAVSQPVADERLPKICSGAADALGYLLACTVAMLLMCVLMVTMALSVNLSGGSA